MPLFGAESTNLAPPIIIDDLPAEHGNSYLGKKFGLTSGIDSPAREALALQYMSDMNDMHSELVQKAMAGRLATPPDVAALQEYITGSRYKAFLAAINRAIAGPFFFGAEPPTLITGGWGRDNVPREILGPLCRNRATPREARAEADGDRLGHPRAAVGGAAAEGQSGAAVPG